MTSSVDTKVADALAARERLRAALRSRDVDALTQLLGDDLVVNAPINRIVGRDDVLGRAHRAEAHQSDGPTTTRKEYTQAREGVVVIMGDEIISAADDASNADPVRRRFTDIWRPHAASWPLTISQITITEPMPA